MGSPSLTPTLMCLLICETVGFSVFHVAFRAALNASGWRVLYLFYSGGSPVFAFTRFSFGVQVFFRSICEIRALPLGLHWLGDLYLFSTTVVLARGRSYGT